MNADNKHQYQFERAFELAYLIHANKDLAFFIAEDALDELPTMLGKQEKNRRSPERLLGFWKGGERARPIRQTIRINETQMLQWLVYKHSESWERQTERGQGIYLPTEEDMVVRYVEHLVFNTLRRGSFYVTLAVGPLLHQLDRRETRLFYEVLTQGDSARIKDMSYIGKQRLELLEHICQRFGQMVQTVTKSGDEKQFVMQTSDQRLVDLVHGCLRHFTPWDTECVVQSGFDVTDIPAFYFSGTPDSDEDSIEMNRIHTLLHAECFMRFTDGLSRHIRMLPVDNQDKKCNFDSLHDRLKVPQFSNFPPGPPRGDRFHPPDLAYEDYIRLQRTLEARSRRRKGLVPRQLCIYVDNVLVKSFLARRTSTQFVIAPEAGVIEVRGRDGDEELTLATLLVCCDEIPVGGVFKDSVVHQGNQEIEIQLTPIRDARGNIESAEVVVSYAAPLALGSISRLTNGLRSRFTHLLRHQISEDSRSTYRWLVRAGLLVVLVALVVMFIWLRQRPKKEVPERAAEPPVEQQKPGSPPIPSPPQQPSVSKEAGALIARATWSTDPQDVLSAITIEPTRGEAKAIDLAGQTRISLSLPQYNEAGQKYSRYRVVIAGGKRKLWQQLLRAPSVSLTGNAHILNLVLSPERVPQKIAIDLRVEGWGSGQWHPLGHALLNPTGR
jgi:hypothetical protein